MRRPTRRGFLARVGAGAVGMAASPLLGRAARGAAGGAGRWNFVLILVDDLGWADLGCYGSTYHESPHIDRLAREGMRFTDAYAAAPVCSPTRASILTGQYPARLHLTDFIPGHRRPWARLRVPEFNLHLPLEAPTIPRALKRAGYVSAHIGKWHLGAGPGYRPAAYGFDVTVGGVPGREDKQVGGLTDAALAFIEKNGDRPFLLQLSHHTVHIPLEARADLVAKYRAKRKARPGLRPDSHPIYAAMIEALDDSVARITAALARLMLAERTVLIFTSDNGGLIKTHTGRGPVVTSNAPLRSEKGTLYEGGIRVPLIVRWPGAVKPGAVCHTPASSIDFLPTMLGVAGVPSPPVDGESLVPLLRGSGVPEREALYWHYPHYHHMDPCGAIRRGDWKLVEHFENGRLELYNLGDDVGERMDLADARPEKAAALRGELAAWRRAVGAQMPASNPDYDPARARTRGRRARGKRRKR